MVKRMSATLIKLASSHRLSPVDGWKKMACQARISSLRSSQGRTLAITHGRLLVSASQTPVVTEPTLALRALRQASARFRRTAGRTHHFPPASLHFTSISQATFTFHSFRRPQTAETVKDSGAPKDARGRDAPHIGQDSNMAARLRPAKKSAIARDASHGQDTSITARGSACRRGRGNNREIGHFCTASISQAALQRTETAELTGKTKLV